MKDLTSEQLLLCQFKSDVTPDIEFKLEELFWKRRVEALEAGFSWKVDPNSRKPTTSGQHFSPPLTPPTSELSLPRQIIPLPTVPKTNTWTRFGKPIVWDAEPKPKPLIPNLELRISARHNNNKPTVGSLFAISHPHPRLPKVTASQSQYVPQLPFNITPTNRIPLEILSTLSQLYIQFPGENSSLPTLLETVEDQHFTFVHKLGVSGWTYFHSNAKYRFYLAFENLSARNLAEKFVRENFIENGNIVGALVEKGGTEELWTWADFEDSYTNKWIVKSKKRGREDDEDDENQNDDNFSGRSVKTKFDQELDEYLVGGSGSGMNSVREANGLRGLYDREESQMSTTTELNRNSSPPASILSSLARLPTFTSNESTINNSTHTESRNIAYSPIPGIEDQIPEFDRTESSKENVENVEGENSMNMNIDEVLEGGEEIDYDSDSSSVIIIEDDETEFRFKKSKLEVDLIGEGEVIVKAEPVDDEFSLSF